MAPVSPCRHGKAIYTFCRPPIRTSEVLLFRQQGGRSVIVTTIDPVTGNKVTDLEHHPFVVEGSGVAALKIYFESEETRRSYLMAQPTGPDDFEDDTFHHS